MTVRQLCKLLRNAYHDEELTEVNCVGLILHHVIGDSCEHEVLLRNYERKSVTSRKHYFPIILPKQVQLESSSRCISYDDKQVYIVRSSSFTVIHIHNFQNTNPTRLLLHSKMLLQKLIVACLLAAFETTMAAPIINIDPKLIVRDPQRDGTCYKRDVPGNC